MKKRATITDVATLAGVSIKTVSRVFNREPNVRESLRERVLSAGESLGYAPSLSARGLAGARSFVVALLFDNPSLAYIAEVQSGALRRCREARYHLIVEPIESAAVTQRTIEQTLASTRPDGLILTPPVSDNPVVLDAIEQAGFAHVRIAPARDLERGPYVRINDRQAAREMTERMIDLGHERIAFVRGHPDHGAAAERHDGYLDALRAWGRPAETDLIVRGDFTFESGMACGEALLKRKARPSAIFASNDDMALGVMAAAERAGLAIPGDVSVAGFDDSPSSRKVWPPLTTVRQPMRDMADAAVEIAVAVAAAKADANLARTLPYEIVTRASTARLS